MDVKILGPLEANENGVSITPSASKPRQILALLALEARRVVPVPTMIEELWGAQPPRSALTTLQTYIMQLRRAIQQALPPEYAGGAKRVLTTRYGGYLLDVASDDTDVACFERLSTAGQRALEEGRYELASRLLRSALGIWRGPALVDVQTGFRLSVEVTRLEESRLGVVESRIEADLRLGRHHTVLSELAVLTARHSMHEYLCELYMLALYRSGRQWRALDVYKAFRNGLVEEIGVEPSARLQRLQRTILSSDPVLDEHTDRWAYAQAS